MHLLQIEEKLILTTTHMHARAALFPTSSATNSPVTFLVQVPAALRAVLLVTLRLVQAVGGALPHL